MATPEPGTPLPWRRAGFSGPGRDLVVDHWIRWFWTENLKDRGRLRTALARWLSVLGETPWVRQEYGHERAAFVARGQALATTNGQSEVDAAWELLLDFAVPLEQRTLAIHTDLMPLVRPSRDGRGLTGALRESLEGQLREKLRTVIRGALADLMISRAASQELCLPDRGAPETVVATVARKAADILAKSASALKPEERDYAYPLIEERIAELAARYGRNPPPPAPPQGALQRAEEHLQNLYLRARQGEWVPTYEGKVRIDDVIDKAYKSALKDCVRHLAEGRPLLRDPLRQQLIWKAKDLLKNQDRVRDVGLRLPPPPPPSQPLTEQTVATPGAAIPDGVLLGDGADASVWERLALRQVELWRREPRPTIEECRAVNDALAREEPELSDLTLEDIWGEVKLTAAEIIIRARESRPGSTGPDDEGREPRESAR